MSANRPATVELLVGLRSVTGVEPLVRALGRFAVVRAPDRALATPDARVATSTDAPGLPDALHDEAVPLAVALREGEEPPAELVAHVSALLVARRPGMPPFGAPVVAWPHPSIDTAAHPPLSPLVRRRWRRMLGLPDELVVVLGFDPVTPLPDAAIASALAICDAAAVRGPWTLLALALGTPLVTDALSAQRLGARDDREVALATPANAVEEARHLAGDVRRATRLGAGGRRLAEQVHDVAPYALALARRLGIVVAERPHDVLQARLTELGTPPGAHVMLRALAAAEPFVSLSAAPAAS
jgi:hypothetical protein